MHLSIYLFLHLCLYIHVYTIAFCISVADTIQYNCSLYHTIRLYLMQYYIVFAAVRLYLMQYYCINIILMLDLIQ